MRLLLVRHGQTPSNVQRLLDTRVPGPGLTDLGEQQAAAVPAALAGERIDAIYASTQVRSQLTAQPLAAERGLGVQVRAGIRELSAGDLEMRADEDAVRTYLTTVFAWAGGDEDVRMPGGESGVEALGRFDEVVAEAAAAHDVAAFFSHGAAIRVWSAARAANVDLTLAGRPLDNTGLVVLEGSPADGWTALTWAGRPVGGPAPADPGDAGPTGEPVAVADAD